MAVVCASASTQVANKIKSAQASARATVMDGDAPEPDKDHRREDNPYLSKHGANGKR